MRIPPPEECEPFELGNLEKYEIKHRLLGIALDLENDNDTNFFDIEKAEGNLPPLSLGEVWFNDAKRDVEEFVERWKDDLTGNKEEPVSIDQELKGIRIRGELGPFINGKQVLYRCVKETKGKTVFEPGLGICLRLHFKKVVRKQDFTHWIKSFSLLSHFKRKRPSVK